MRIVGALLLASVLSAAQTSSAPAGADSTSARASHSVEQLANRYFDEYYFPFNPTAGTSAGFHQYDTKLEDYSAAGVKKQISLLKDFKQRFERLDVAGADYATVADRDLVLADINSRLLELENIRGWEKNPDVYSSGITGSAFVIMARNFAPPEQRLRSLIAREKQMPAALQAARQNLKDPPQIYTEVALEQLPGNVSFFKNDVPAAFRSVSDARLRAEFDKSNAAVIAALNDYGKWMKSDLLPRSHGDFRIGADNFRKKLLYNEMVDIDLDRLYDIGMQDLRQNQQRFQETAKLIDANKKPADILKELETDHPAPDKLLSTFRNTLSGLVTFINQKNIVTIPSKVPPIVEETPPFMRALTFASMDTPGPYESHATEAFFNVTLPEATWTKQQIDEHMAAFNRGTVVSTAIHEVYPGHYTQFLWVKQAPSKVRKLLGCSSNAEGWAHYTEQMMLDEGYGSASGEPSTTDKKYLMLRLGQLQDALLRNARYIVGLQMHRGKMSFDEGVAFFQNEGYQEHENALRETKRGTSDPTYMYYTLGKLEILKLRDDYRKKVGDQNFSLEQFHNAFLKQGFPPIKIIRRILLGDDSPTL